MQRSIQISLVLLMALLWGGRAHAEKFPSPKVDYSADMTMKMDDGPEEGHALSRPIDGKIYFSKGNVRHESLIMGHTSIAIRREDKGVTWMLMPEEKMYMESRSDDEEKKQDPSDKWQKGNIKMTKVGSEKVNGVDTIKYKVDVTGEDGRNEGGYAWLSKENIPVRMDGASRNDKRQARFTIDYKNMNLAQSSKLKAQSRVGPCPTKKWKFLYDQDSEAGPWAIRSSGRISEIFSTGDSWRPGDGVADPGDASWRDVEGTG